MEQVVEEQLDATRIQMRIGSHGGQAPGMDPDVGVKD